MDIADIKGSRKRLAGYRSKEKAKRGTVIALVVVVGAFILLTF